MESYATIVLTKTLIGDHRHVLHLSPLLNDKGDVYSDLCESESESDIFITIIVRYRILMYIWCHVSYHVIISCDQAALWMVQSVCPSVCLWHRFHYVPVTYHHEIHQTLLPLTEVMSVRKVKVRGQKSRSQWSRSNLTISKVIRQISRSHGFKNRRLWPKLGVSGL